jgi:hypothetical protein
MVDVLTLSDNQLEKEWESIDYKIRNESHFSPLDVVKYRILTVEMHKRGLQKWRLR